MPNKRIGQKLKDFSNGEKKKIERKTESIVNRTEKGRIVFSDRWLKCYSKMDEHLKRIIFLSFFCVVSDLHFFNKNSYRIVVKQYFLHCCSANEIICTFEYFC